MANFTATPTILRDTGTYLIAQEGASVSINGRMANITLIADIEANPKHYMTMLLPKFRAMNAVAVVRGIERDSAMFALTAEQYALGAEERARYAAWNAGCVAIERDRQAKERLYDGQNEGGDGYNPYRSGDTPTYWGRR